MKKYTNEEIIDLFNNFDKSIYSLVISSINENITAQTSYSPFIKIDNKYYAVMSSNMPHYKNIIRNKSAHVLIIEDEQDASHIYARKRLYFDASCEEVSLDEYYDKFKLRFEDQLSFIKTMKDFTIIELTPKEKSLVLGFGAAYKMDEKGNLLSKSISHK